MGRRRVELKLHKVKGYYSTHRVGRRTQYKYFGTHDPEVAFQALRKWRAVLRRAEVAGMTLDDMAAATRRKKMAVRKLWARFILSLSDDNDETQEQLMRKYRRWLKDQDRKALGRR